ELQATSTPSESSDAERLESCPCAGGAEQCSPARERWVPLARVLSPSGAKDSLDQHLSALWASYRFSFLTQRSRAGLHCSAPPALFIHNSSRAGLHTLSRLRRCWQSASLT